MSKNVEQEQKQCKIKLANSTNHYGIKLINSPDTCVVDMLTGVAQSLPGLVVCPSSKIVMRCYPNTSCNTVGLVSGGGSGHEPFAAGFVGRGMLNAAVAGSLFTSPPSAHCLTAIQNVARFHSDVLVLILNYTGDLLHFGQAIETAMDQGINVASVVVDDDCALIGSTDRFVTQRGICGMLFAIKIAGALAVAGYKLRDIVSACETVVKNVATLGVCTKPCILPGADRPLFSLGVHEMQIGVGLHGEAGIALTAGSAVEVVDAIVSKIKDTLKLVEGDVVCIIINNLGSSSQLELYIVAKEVKNQLHDCGISVARLYVGTLMTSLDMGGIHVSVLRTTNNPNFVDLLDEETEAYAWPGCSLHSFVTDKVEITLSKSALPTSESVGYVFSKDEAELFEKCMIRIADCLIAAEQRLNELDSGCGDGDCGTTMRHFADGITLLNSNKQLKWEQPVNCFLTFAKMASESMGGTSGALYCIMLRGAARHVPNWPVAWMTALDTVQRYSSAKVGHRTMMDALIPACNEFNKYYNENGWNVAMKAAVDSAEAGCESTHQMDAMLGRAAYVDKKYWVNVDAGAYGVTIWLRAIFQQLTEDLVSKAGALGILF